MESTPTKLPPPKIWFTAPTGVFKCLSGGMKTIVEIEVVPIKKSEYVKCLEVYPQNPELCQPFLRDSS
jgi:hypothetical protein